MADLSTNIPQISFGQADKETAVNELFDAASPSMLFGRNGITSAGLNFGIFGGRFKGLVIANSVQALTASATSYIEADATTGAVTKNTTGWTTGKLRLYKCVTNATAVTSYEDHRMLAAGTMSNITDKQGKVLDDPVIVSDGNIDSLMTPGGYLFDSNPANGIFAGAAVLVSATDGYAFQQIFSPISGVIGMRYHDGASWLPLFSSVTLQMVQDWYDNTTAEAPNAVINSDGTFSRSIATFNPNPLLVVSGASHAFVKADVNKYARYTSTGAKTATFDSGEGFASGDEFHITNRAASGNITISGTGVTFNAPKNGTLVLEPGDTVTVKFVSTTTADVMGSTGAA